ncbi:MAG TPA: beta-galactosidase [Candidatus Blautia pullicola]|uniref:Beta-galactosidase n=1 Tax=Candidatus Blautia pullicola TaxID=2838498 RepID=A0A9D2JU04_9FIRM|nr:beta-galactosidase [Candidatus Blautia pullicola]
MEHQLNLQSFKKKERYRLSDRFYGQSKDGKELSFNNYYMEMDGKPFFGISGECHYSRVSENQWEDTILKMKMGGINILATYIFWIHHEEEEGKFRFDGNRNVRKFLKLCKKHGMYVIVRIGPFDHGEVRNGGLPDWLYGKPFDVRSLNEGFLNCTRTLYRQLARQFEGLYFKDGGPIIGAQIENEYMHSAAPWELTTGVSNEWIPGGSDGTAYMKALKDMAVEEGICTPFYTCTGWGGAAMPTEEMLPLWGGYAFWPWIFYDYEGEHPATPEYIYRDNHNNAVPKTYNFEPVYEPESFPYACCEMGGGMSCFYNYRFQFPFESVDAMANIKLAGGCNFLGYYMYRGGSNPRGEKTPYLNECQCPKISYDYQAAIGEFGQLRPSYHRLKALHLFVTNFGDEFCQMQTVLPENSQEISPEDTETLRYAVRTDGEKGFLFLNNYQDHVICQEKKDENILLRLPKEDLYIEGISLAPGEEAVFPFGLKVEGFRLKYAKAQLLTVIREAGKVTYFFFAPQGTTPEYVWDTEGIESIDGNPVEGREIRIRKPANEMSSYCVAGEDKEVTIITLTREQSLSFYQIEVQGQPTAVLCDSPFLYNEGQISLESPDKGDRTQVLFYPEQKLAMPLGVEKMNRAGNQIMKGYEIFWKKEEIQEQPVTVREVGNFRYVLELPEHCPGKKDSLLRIGYEGDVGSLFADSLLISDNFNNQALWEIGLKEALPRGTEKELTLFITPLKENVKVDVSSTMAGRMEVGSGCKAGLLSAVIKPVQEILLSLEK